MSKSNGPFFFYVRPLSACLWQTKKVARTTQAQPCACSVLCFIFPWQPIRSQKERYDSVSRTWRLRLGFLVSAVSHIAPHTVCYRNRGRSSAQPTSWRTDPAAESLNVPAGTAKNWRCSHDTRSDEVRRGSQATESTAKGPQEQTGHTRSGAFR